MVVDVLPDWLIQSTLSVEGLHIAITSQINLREKLVSFKVSLSGWLLTASSPTATIIKDSIIKRAEQIKLQKEESARKSGWIVVEGDLDRYQNDSSTVENCDDKEIIPLAS